MEDFATRRWRGRRHPNGGFWGFVAVGPQDGNGKKRALHNPIIIQQHGPWQALHGTHRQIPQRRGLHTVAGTG
eukprot:4627704-Prymnesium_polylepis.1